MRRCPCACIWGTGRIVGSWCRVRARGGKRLRSVGLVGGQLVRRRLCVMHPCFLRVLHKAWHVVGVREASVSVECAKERMHMSPTQRSTPEGRNHLPPLCFPALHTHTHTHTQNSSSGGVCRYNPCGVNAGQGSKDSGGFTPNARVLRPPMHSGYLLLWTEG